jgi:protein gp37
MASVEHQAAADDRVPKLIRVPAVARGLSCEPLLGPVDLRAYLSRGAFLACTRCRFASNAPTAICPNDGTRMVSDVGIDWVIIGAESGPGARPADPAWFRSIVEQCRAASVAVFVKQIFVDGKLRHDVREFPVDLQIQEFPR